MLSAVPSSLTQRKLKGKSPILNLYIREAV